MDTHVGLAYQTFTGSLNLQIVLKYALAIKLEIKIAMK